MTSNATGLATIAALGVGVYAWERYSMATGPVTGAGNAVTGRYALTRAQADDYLARIWYQLQGFDMLEASDWDTFTRSNEASKPTPTLTVDHLRFMHAWRLAEGGKATWNPWNTTWRGGSIKTYNSAGVGQYATAESGILATTKTLKLKYYRDLVTRMTTPDATAEYIAASPDLVTWRRGFKPDDGRAYVAGILASYPKPADGKGANGITGIPYRYPIYGV